MPLLTILQIGIKILERKTDFCRAIQVNGAVVFSVPLILVN